MQIRLIQGLVSLILNFSFIFLGARFSHITKNQEAQTKLVITKVCKLQLVATPKMSWCRAGAIVAAKVRSALTLAKDFKN